MDLYYNNGMILRRHCKKRAQTGRSMIMGMATSKVRLNICGSSYVVNTSESEDYMQNLAAVSYTHLTLPTTPYV